AWTDLCVHVQHADVSEASRRLVQPLIHLVRMRIIRRSTAGMPQAQPRRAPRVFRETIRSIKRQVRRIAQQIDMSGCRTEYVEHPCRAINPLRLRELVPAPAYGSKQHHIRPDLSNLRQGLRAPSRTHGVFLADALVEERLVDHRAG